MKPIVEYCKANLINEYLSTNNISKKKILGGFPKEKDKNDIVYFLENNGFVEIEREPSESYVQTLNKKELRNTLRYIKDDETIAFCNVGNLSKENPVFDCELKSKEKYAYMTIWPVYDDTTFDWHYFKNYQEFVNKVNKHFGWE